MWILFALIASVISAFYYLFAQNLKIKTNAYLVFRGLGMAVFLLPILILFPSVFPPAFYITSFLQGCIVAYSDYLAFRVNKNYGSETLSSILPFSVVISFFGWFFVEPELIFQYAAQPLKTTIVLLSLFGGTYALLQYRQINLTRKAFYLLLPVLFLSSVISILSKLIMSYSVENELLCACQRTWIVGFVVGVIHLIIYVKKKLPLKDLIEPATIKKGMLFILLLFVMIFKSLAMYFAQNPAYVMCLVYLALIWIMLLSSYVPAFKFKHFDRQAKRKWELLFVVSVIVLVLFGR